LKKSLFTRHNFAATVYTGGLGVLWVVQWLFPWHSGVSPMLDSWLWSLGALAGVLLWRLPSTHVFSLSGLLAWAVALAAGISVVFGLLQFAGLAEGLSWIHASAQGEVYANLRQTNHFATLTSLGLLALLFLGQRSAWVAAPDGGLAPLLARKQLVLLLGVMLLALGNALSGSRTGMLQWVLIFAAAWLMPGGQRSVLRLAVFALLLYSLFVLLAPWLAQWVNNPRSGLLGRIEDTNAFSRLALWANVLELIGQKPGLGHGWGSLAYAHYSNSFESTRFMEMLDNAHNLPLHLAVELGVPVAVAFCALVGWWVWRNKPWAETQPDRQMAWGMLLVIGIHSLVEYPLWYGPFFMTALLCVGVLCAEEWQYFWQKGHLAPVKYGVAAINSGAIWVQRGVAVLLLAGTAFVAFDYHRVSQIYLQPAERSSWYASDALGAAQRSVLFKSHAKFAELVITPLSPQTAPRVLQLSSELVFWSPEPRVIEKLIESATMLEMHDVALFHWRRYRQAYPVAYEAWSTKLKAGAGQLSGS
jgi:O-antigen ligase